MSEDKQINSFGKTIVKGVKSFLGSSTGGAIASGAIGLGQSLFNNHLAKQSANEQYERQLDFWNKQNQYNSPSSQRQRFQSAGINPNAVTGEMASSGTAQQLSSVPGNEYAQSGVIQLETLAQTLETMARIEKLGAETGLATQEMEIKALEKILIGVGIDRERVQYMIDQWKEKRDKLEYENLPAFFEHRNKMYDLEESYKSAQIEYEKAQTELANANTEESKESAKKLVAETGLIALKQDTEKMIAELTEQQRYESKSRTNLNRQEFRFNQVTENLRVKSLRIANEIGASEAQIKDIEVTLSQLEEQLSKSKQSMYVDEDGTPTAWSYISEGLSKVGEIIGIALVPSVGGAAQLGKMIKPAKKIGF